MDFDGLRHFLHLSRTLHFGRTAREIQVSPSALSRAIQRLEEDAGALLLIRNGRKVELTPAGLAFQSYASTTLSELDRVREAIRRQDPKLSGTLRVFCSVTAAHSFLPTLLSRFRQAYPAVTIKLETGYAGSALDMLERGVVDVSVAVLPDHVPRGLVARAITDTPLLFVAPRMQCEVARLIEQSPIDWVKVPMVMPEPGLARTSAERWLRQHGLRARGERISVYGVVPGNEAALALVSLGCGVGIVPQLVLEKSPLRSEVRTLEVRPRLPELRVGICAKQVNVEQPVVAAFWRSISQPSAVTRS